MRRFLRFLRLAFSYFGRLLSSPALILQQATYEDAFWVKFTVWEWTRVSELLSISVGEFEREILSFAFNLSAKRKKEKKSNEKKSKIKKPKKWHEKRFTQVKRQERKKCFKWVKREKNLCVGWKLVRPDVATMILFWSRRSWMKKVYRESLREFWCRFLKIFAKIGERRLDFNYSW